MGPGFSTGVPAAGGLAPGLRGVRVCRRAATPAPPAGPGAHRGGRPRGLDETY